MAPSDSPSLTCPIVLEWMNSQQEVTRKLNFKSGLLRILRNDFREIFLEISSEKSSKHKFHLKNITVHSKFMKEGKCTIVFKEDRARAMICNAPPAQLTSFLKLMYVKLQGDTGGKVSLKERLEGRSAMDEISPLTSKEVSQARDKLGSQGSDTTPKLAKTISRKVDRNHDRTSAAQPPSKRRCFALTDDTLPLTSEQDRILKAVVSGRNIFFTGWSLNPKDKIHN